MDYLNHKEYRKLHNWINYHWGKANHCELCGLDKIPKGKIVYFDWANKTGIYNKDKKNWWQLCKSCHKLYDIEKYKLVAWNKGMKRKFNNALEEWRKKGGIVWNKGKKETRQEVIEKLRNSHLRKIPWNKGIKYKQRKNR